MNMDTNIRTITIKGRRAVKHFRVVTCAETQTVMSGRNMISHGKNSYVEVSKKLAE